MPFAHWLLLAADAAPAVPADALTSVLSSLGVGGALLASVLWFIRHMLTVTIPKQQETFTAALKETNDSHRHGMDAMTKGITAALERNTATMERNTEALGRAGALQSLASDQIEELERRLHLCPLMQARGVDVGAGGHTGGNGATTINPSPQRERHP